MTSFIEPFSQGIIIEESDWNIFITRWLRVSILTSLFLQLQMSEGSAFESGCIGWDDSTI
jgi:hypothetical protein